MRLRILSDLHIEHFRQGRSLPEAAADVVILAGDIHSGSSGIEWAARQFPDQPVLYVPGNHEYYGYSMPALRAELQAEAKRLGIRLLDNTSVVIDGVKFLGTTLWTDFALYADSADENAELTYAKALAVMPDFSIIEQPEGLVFTPEESQRLHRVAIRWLEQALSVPFAGPKVVISHHAPLAACIPPRYQGDILSPAFASRLSQLMGRAALWIHGHVHEPVDLECRGTRIIANPGGYPNEFDPPCFVPDLVVDLPRPGQAEALCRSS
ncbi:metallophosphoesterase family protein [Marinobacterium sp. D7]|uniref:metallophosphoesterase n=1 Tax=Marinobacterium ramblicola TaxID=2849041 RepID=UPI001C2D9DB8|nr:metallophosphoesterase [Marinobacterium ramblicola]MBV1788229.1 metallophosphoesterase family protein [Marinobacterium ramblicola]